MSEENERTSTGVVGLDEILRGGLIKKRAYLVRGGPGQGKTTLGLHFLAAAGADEPTLFIGFQEPESQVKANAEAVGVDTTGIHFLSLTPDEEFFVEQQGYDVFTAAEIEQEPLAKAMIAAVEQHEPRRVFVDSLTQLRFLSADTFQYRKQVLSFLRFLTQRGATVLFSSESSRELPDDDLQFMTDGVINFEAEPSGSTVHVTKFRGSSFQRGRHHMRLGHEGIKVFPQMIPPARKAMTDERKRWRSGCENLDTMLHGGFEAGTITLITGPTGVGKSTLAAQFAAMAAGEGRQAAVFLFEEEVETYLRRARALGIEVERPHADGRLIIELVEPMRYLADEFTARVRQHVEEQELDLVVLDSVAGFELTLEGDGMEGRLHSFAKSLARMGVTVLLLNETQAVTGAQFRATEKGISYLSDNVLFMRYMELDGALKKALGVLKKRLSGFESGLRSFEIGHGGLLVEEPIEGLHGVLSGAPTASEDAQ